MSKIVQFPQRKWHRHPIYWAARNTWEMLCETPGAILIAPTFFLALLTLACLARLPFRWRIVEAADMMLRETGEYL